VDTDGTGGWESRTRSEYLNDARNHTGHSQVIGETEYDADTDFTAKTIDYSFGHDEITQTTQLYSPEGEPECGPSTVVFGHDGHGRVRLLTNDPNDPQGQTLPAITQLFAYDAHGRLLAILNGAGTLISGGTSGLADSSAAMTSVLYSGAQFDSRIGQARAPRGERGRRYSDSRPVDDRSSSGINSSGRSKNK
jgi:hypothetical protein